MFSESKFIPYEQMRALFDTEKVWLNKRERMSKESTDESKKYENNEALLTELNKNIKQILGEEMVAGILLIKERLIEHWVTWISMERRIMKLSQ